ncbi:MAG: glycosyltransferase [Clostridia bacterium]|nr:glycosyltransferase [Clostridia bacterium]
MNDSEPLVSIIIPVYNTEKYVERCIQSVEKQDYNNLEIIVVDDGSTDNSLTICKKIAQNDSRIKLIHKENQGAGFARNTGLDNASGKYVMFIDSDDYILQGCIKRIVEIAEKGNFDVVKFGTIKGKENIYTDIIKQKEIKIYNNYTAFETRDVNILICAKLFKLDIFKNIRYPKKSTHDDEFITYKIIYLSNSIAVVDENYYYYYMSDNSIMRKKRIQMPLEYMEAYEERKKYFIENNEQRLYEISAREFAIRLLVSYLKYDKFDKCALSRKELLNKYRKEYKIGKDTIVSIKEKISLGGCYVFPNIIGPFVNYIWTQKKKKR